MANIVGLALKVTGDASGLAKSLTPVDRALDKLAAQAEKATNVFTPFAEKTAAAGKAQEEFAAKFSALADQLRDNVVGPQEYAAAFGQLTEEAKGAAAAFQEGLRITQQNQTAEQARTASLERLNELLKLGAIDARNFGLESAKLSEGSDSTALDRFAEAIAPLRAALEGGTLSAERFAEQSQEIAAAISGSTPAAERQATAILDLRNRFEAGRVSIEQYREEFSRIQSGDIATTFEVQVVGVREGVEASNELRASLAQLTDTQITAALQVAGVEQLDDLRQQFAGIDGAQIDAVLKVLGVETIEAARQQLESLSNTDASATISIANAAEVQDTIRSIESSFGSLEAAQSRLASLPDVDLKATLEVLGVDSIDAARERLIALGALQIEPKLQTIGFESIDSARAALESLGDRSITATLEFLGTAKISDAAEQLATLDGTSVQAFLQATGFDSIEAAQAKLGELQDVDVTATLQLLGVDTIDEARQRLASISTVDIEPVLRLLGVDSIEAARQQLASVDGTEIDTQLRVLGVDGIESAAALLSSVEGKNVDLIAKTLGFDSVASLSQAIDAAESKTVTFDVASNADEEAARIADLVAEQDAYQAAVAEGLRVTDQVRTAEERRATELEKIERLLSQGAISEETAGRARDKITGASEAAAAAEQEFSRAKEQAGRIIEASLTATERAQRSYDAAIAQAQDLERRGLLTKEQLNAEIRRQADLFAKAAVSAGKYAGDVDKAGNAGLKFNELSGILGLLPGQIGGVASRLSSFASAGEGIQKLFAGGVTDAVTSLGGSIAGLVNPFSLAVAGITAFGAAASAVVSGLTNLEDRVEKLGNTADKLGVSFEFIQTLEEAANRSGTSVDSVSAAFGRLQKSVLGVDEESKAAQKALQEIGVTSEQLAALKPEEQYRLIGEELRGIEDPAKRTATAVALFGKAGAELIPFFNNFAGAAVDVERFNAQLSSIDRTRIDGLGASFDTVRVSLTGLGNELLTPFIGITQSLGDGLSSAIATFGRSIGAVLDIFSPLTSIVGVAGNLFLQFGATLGNLVGTVLEPFATAGRLISSAVDAISRSLTAVFGRVNDAVIGFREFFRFEGVALQFSAAFDAIGETLDRVGAIASRFAEVVGQAIGRVGTILGDGVSQFLEFTGLGATVSAFADGVVAAFSGLYEGIKTVVGQVGGFIEQVLKFAEDWLGIVPEIEQPVEATVELNDGGVIEELLKESKDLQKTLDDITSSVGKAIDESAKFGQAGFDAALQYQQSVDDLKAKLDAGLFNEETFRREAARVGEVFKTELSRIEEEAKLDIQISDETAKTLDGLQDKINKVADDATKFGQSGFDAAAQFQDKLRELGQQFEDGRINATSLAAETAKATAEYDKQIAGFKAIDELQKSILKADQDRVAALLAQNNVTTELEQNQAAVQREQVRLEEEIRRQREDGNVFAADAAASRLAQLDQEAAKLEDIQQATDQGFSEGFQKSFEATAKSIDDLSLKAEQFGNVGALAAEALRLGVERAQLQARDGILTQETYDREVARQQSLFDQRLAAAKRVEDFLANAFGQRNKAELEAVAQLEERKKQAEVNVQAIQAQINTEQLKRDATTNLGERRAATQRIAALRQAERIEGGIAEGRNEVARNQASGLASGFGAAEQFQSRVAQTNDNFLQAFTGTYAAANASLNAANAVAAELARQQELSRPVAGSVATADIRTAEGAALVLGLGAAAQDPNLIEARLQTKQLAGIRTAITNAVSGYLGTVAEIF